MNPNSIRRPQSFSEPGMVSPNSLASSSGSRDGYINEIRRGCREILARSRAHIQNSLRDLDEAANAINLLFSRERQSLVAQLSDLQVATENFLDDVNSYASYEELISTFGSNIDQIMVLSRVDNDNYSKLTDAAETLLRQQNILSLKFSKLDRGLSTKLYWANIDTKEIVQYNCKTGVIAKSQCPNMHYQTNALSKWVTLPSGDQMFAGGYNGKPMSDCFLFNFDRQEYTSKPRMLHGHALPAMCVYHKTGVFVFSSFQSNDKVAEVFDLRAEQWTQIPDVPIATRTCQVVDNHIYLVGWEASDKLLRYAPDTQTYEVFPLTPSLSATQKIFYIDSQLFVIGGNDVRQISATGETIESIPGCDESCGHGDFAKIDGVAYYVTVNGFINMFNYSSKTAPKHVVDLSSF